MASTRVHYTDTPPRKLILVKIKLLDLQQLTTNYFLRLRYTILVE